MSKRENSKYKINRRLGANMWGRPKSPYNRREYPPGQHGRGRATVSQQYRIAWFGLGQCKKCLGCGLDGGIVAIAGL